MVFLFSASFAVVVEETPAKVLVVLGLDALVLVATGSVVSAHEVAAPNRPAAIGATMSAGSQRNVFLLVIVFFSVVFFVFFVLVIVVIIMIFVSRLWSGGLWCSAR